MSFLQALSIYMIMGMVEYFIEITTGDEVMNLTMRQYPQFTERALRIAMMITFMLFWFPLRLSYILGYLKLLISRDKDE